MTFALPLLIALCAALLGLVTFVQLLYLESLRLRTRDLPAIKFFRETLEDKIGFETEDGAGSFSVVKHTAILLLFAALALMVLEAKFASHGILGVAGILCLVFGLATLVDGPTPEMRVHFGVAAGAGVGFGVITFGLAWIAFKARRAKRLTGADALLGHPAITITALYPSAPGPALDPAAVGQPIPGSAAANIASGQPPAAHGAIGQVEVRGEIWQATLPPNAPPIPAGTPVTVRAINGLTLTVTP